MEVSFHILIVDDDADDAELLMAAFHAVAPAARFTTVQTGQHALDLLLNNGGASDYPELAFLDLHMPGLTGGKVLELLRASERCREFPVVVISTAFMPDEIEQCRALRTVAHFTKPNLFEDFDPIVQSTLEFLRTKRSLNRF